MIIIPGLNLCRHDEWAPAMIKLIQDDYPVGEKTSYIEHPFIIEEEVSCSQGSTSIAEFTLIRGIIKQYYFSFSRTSDEYHFHSALEFSVEIEQEGVEHVFIFFAYSSFPHKIHFDKNTPVEIFYMQGVLNINEIE